jgi:hypothetical protein
MCDRRTDIKKKIRGGFLVKIFGKERASERRNENIIVSGTLKNRYCPSINRYYPFKNSINSISKSMMSEQNIRLDLNYLNKSMNAAYID